MFWTYFLKLSLAHIVERFVFEPHLHGLDNRSQMARSTAFSLIKVALITAFLSNELHRSMMITLVLYGVTTSLMERAVDIAKRSAWESFLWSQLGVVITCAAIADWWVSGGNIPEMRAMAVKLANDHRVLWTMSTYLSVIFGGEQLTRRVAVHFSRQFPPDLRAQKPGLQDAGKYIGWLERLLILTFVVGDYGEAVGFLLAVKALVRYPEISEDKKGLFAEYVLIGTLTSVGIALLGGVILRVALQRPL